MNGLDYRYTYEVHFPNTEELFYSDLETAEFLNQLNRPGGLTNTDGDTVVIPRAGNVIGRMVCYVKQVDNHKPF